MLNWHDLVEFHWDSFPTNPTNLLCMNKAHRYFHSYYCNNLGYVPDYNLCIQLAYTALPQQKEVMTSILKNPLFDINIF